MVYEEQFGENLDKNYSGHASRTIIIASTPRSGSHYLGHAMMSTGVMGVPFEYLHAKNLKTWQDKLGTSGARDTLTEIMKRRTTENGIFSIKVHYSQLASLGSFDELIEFLPNPVIVKLERADILQQAISLAKARQTGVWIKGMTGNGKAAKYDYKLIRRCLEDVAIENNCWWTVLKQNRTPSCITTFEELQNNLSEQLNRIAEFALGRKLSEKELIVKTTRSQSSAAERDMSSSRYLADSQRSSLKWIKLVTSRAKDLTVK